MSSRPLSARPLPSVRLGFYGKIPSRGDFVRCGLSRALVAGWDRWAQTVLAEVSRRDGWTAAWDAAPAWRLSLDADLCGSSPLVGAMIPSRDRSGRRFPLLCAAEGVVDRRDHAELIDAFERVGRDAVETGSPPETLRATLAAIPVPTPAATAPSRGHGRWWLPDAAREVTLSAMPDVETFLRLLLAHEPP